MLEKQSQDVSDGSVAMQAQRDIVINQGMQFSEVKELCVLLWQQNFPSLRDEAVEAARKNVESYIPVLEASIARKINEIDWSRLRDPDIQATINESIQVTARKGVAANYDMLAELVGMRMRAATSPILSIVAEEAVRLVPRLTPSQMSYLALCFFLNRIQFGVTSIEGFDLYARCVISTVDKGFNLSDANIRHAQYAGAVSVISFVESDYYPSLRERYPFLADEANLGEAIASRAPNFHVLCEQYKKSKIYNATLTSVGELLAIMILRGVMPGGLNPETWIN